MITLEEFKRLEIKAARIINVDIHPNADKLYILKVDWGEGLRQLVAGIRNSYQTEDLKQRQIIVLTNLEPANIRGVESQGMLPAVSDEKGISLITPDREVRLGSNVR